MSCAVNFYFTYAFVTGLLPNYLVGKLAPDNPVEIGASRLVYMVHISYLSQPYKIEVSVFD